MKKTLITVGFLVCNILLFAQKKAIHITIQNVSETAHINEIVAVPWASILQQYPKIDTANFKVINVFTNEEIPFQLEKLGQKSVANLLLQLSVGVKQNLELRIEKGKAKPIASKTYARYVPERKDDFAWENDIIAFRVYGKALEGTNENAQGMDLWSKRTHQLVINKWYKLDNYHKDNGDGLDFYSVGMTLGAGDIAPYSNRKIIYPNHYRKYTVLDNGPLRSTFKLDFEAFEVDGRPITMSKTYSLDAGNQLNKVVVEIKDEANRKIPMVIGLVTSHAKGGNKYLGANAGISYYWHKTHPQNGTIGVAALTLGSFDQAFEGEGQLLNQLTISNDNPIVYYNGGVWDKQGDIKTEHQWMHYLQKFKQQLLEPLKISIIK